MLTLKWDSVSYSSKQFGVWRICFGGFLLYYYLRLFPYSVELFSNVGAFPDLPTSQLLEGRFFPTSWLLLDSPWMVQTIVGGCAVCSFLIMLGLARRAAAFVLWILVCWLYSRNQFTDSPDYSFVNWLIFILILIPTGEKCSIGKKNPNWKMPTLLYWGAWIVLAVGYLCAGSNKIRFKDISWIDGTALYYVLNTDNTRFTWFGDFFNSFPMIFFNLLTWGTVVLQIGSPFFIACLPSRRLWWIAMTGMHVFILMFINLPEVTIGMLLFHAFLWSDQLLPTSKRAQQKSA